ncbi:oxidoreductase [Piscinibacter terrae]|uniref:SDR family oxidoreductase n=1 Tax=Piscinibacter terrae TaxID=2496871 RepID=A0A3N7JJV3_9BURK|nr:oxidoreductase [Albitalea terrae]RQP21619.1 SDR family oxidoreductase [Albitalea terrae]
MTTTRELLAGKVVVLVGGAGLLGRSLAQACAEQGASVVIADLDGSRAATACEQILPHLHGGSAHAESVDITSKESLQALIARVSSLEGRIDAVVNSAYPRNPRYGRKLEDVEYADFCENVNLHLGGYFLSTQQFAEHFRRQGHGQVVNVSSIYGVVAPRFEIYGGTPMTMPVEYAAIKSALLHLSRYFMRYYKGTSLRFNCISPGGILDGQPQAFTEAYARYSQSQGMLLPEDFGGTLVYLLSDFSKFVNGQNLIVDDGWST